MNQVDLLIAGRARPAEGGATFDRLDPVTGEVATRAAAASLADADAAVEAAQAAFGAWSAMPPGERRRRLLDAADRLAARSAEFVAIGVAETGAMANWIGFNVALAADMLREAAAMTTQITGQVIPSDVPGLMAMALRRPCGVVLGIAPWNAPVILGTRAIAMPLACGNTVVLKASEVCPGLHRLIGAALTEALGDGVVNVVTNAPGDAAAIVERLVADRRVRRVNFTGSTKVGRIVAGLAARHLKPALLELGGKAPLLVLDDADLDAAAAAARFGAYFNQGQICMSTERLVVDDGVADAFVALLGPTVARMRAGDPRRADVQLGAMVDAQAAARVMAMVGDALAKGATLVAGGTAEGAVMQPTLLDHVTPGMALYREESFGPVCAVIRARGDDELVRIANDSDLGLSAAVFSRDVARGLAVAGRIESGICHVNGATVHDEAQMPFGGVKDSGYGRFGSGPSVAEFTELRWVTLQGGARHYPI